MYTISSTVSLPVQPTQVLRKNCTPGVFRYNLRFQVHQKMGRPNKERRSDKDLFEQRFGVLTFREPFDRQRALYLLQHWDKLPGTSTLDIDQDDQQVVDAETTKLTAKECLAKLLRNAQGSAFIESSYKKAKGSPLAGRWFCANFPSLQTLSRRVRHTICVHMWIDLDFVNCHPVVLEQLCKNQKQPIDCENLTRYINDREGMLEEMMDSGSIPDRDAAKKLILKVLNGGTVKEVRLERVTWWTALCKEFKQIAKEVAGIHENASIKEKCMKDGRPLVEARTMNHVMCGIENQCLESLFDFLRAESCIQDRSFVLVFDGVQILKTEDNTRRLKENDFLKRASQHIKMYTNYEVEVKEKLFDEGFDLPDGFEKSVKDSVVIQSGDDASAGEAFLREHGHHLVKSQKRFFWVEDSIYTEGEQQVKEKITSRLGQMDIEAKTHYGLVPYSKNTRHVADCVKNIMNQEIFIDDDFVDRIWRGNLRYLPWADGVYSFETGELLPYPVKNVFFPFKINRPFPKKIDPEVIDELLKRVIKPIFPNVAQREHYFHVKARALAGEVGDKRWIVCDGDRNSGKGVDSQLTEAAFGGFVATFNSENLLAQRFGSGDMAKKMSWMSKLQGTRIAISNEVSGDIKHIKIDGNMIKKFSSGGDVLEVRNLYQSENEVKLQCTPFMFCNEFPPVSPEDALQTVESFTFKTKFEDATAMKENSDAFPSYCRPSDPSIKHWMAQESVIDAFTQYTLSKYSITRKQPPECVVNDTNVLRGDSCIPIHQRFREVVKYSSSCDDKVFTSMAKLVLQRAGVDMTSKRFESYVEKLFVNEQPPPKRQRLSIDGKQSWGFTNLKLNKVEVYTEAEQS